jgi:hypothetical protein
MELVARGKADPVASFDPPQCLFGFPQHFQPSTEWHAPMQEEVMRTLHPNSPTLKCLLSPGGLIAGILETNDGFRTINVEKEGSLIQIKLPTWVLLSDATQNGGLTEEGQPLGDVPRGIFESIQEVTRRYPFRSLEWLERRILDEHTEVLTVHEEVFDKQTKARVPSTTTWRCVPSRFVQTQMGRSVRFFLDMRKHLGRKGHTIDSFERDIYTTDPHQARVDVYTFEHQPTVQDLKFFDGQDDKSVAWTASLLETPDSSSWATRCALRGVAA